MPTLETMPLHTNLDNLKAKTAISLKEDLQN